MNSPALRIALACAITSLLAACGNSRAPGAGLDPANPPPPVVTPNGLVVKAMTVLPPGQSGFVSTAGQARGQASGAPADFGANLDDQRPLYWNFQFKNGTLGAKPGTPTVPKAGVQIYYDSFGVPIVYGDTVSDIWYGVGYAAAQQRLFLMDAARRLGRGTLSELTGCGSVPADLATRVQTYSEAEYMGFFNALSKDSQDAITGLVAGANAYIAKITTDPSLLPAEYQLLTSVPQPLSIADVAAEGVLITRSVAAEGGNEFLNIKMLQGLETKYGKAPGRDTFLDLVWDEDPKAITTIPRSEGTFSNQDTPAGGREPVFNSVADWAATLPDSIWKGPGTGAATPPQPCGSGGGTISPPSGLGAGVSAVIPAQAGIQYQQSARARKGLDSGLRRNDVALKSALTPAEQTATLARIRATVAGLRKFKLNRGSFAFAVNRTRTKDGGALLVSEPQLGYSYPTQLWEIEVHGAGYDARGSTVPGLPAVGIGYTNNLAWALTTGYSKTVDSFIETICSTAQQTAGTCTRNQYFHAGRWQDLFCRTEVVKYRAVTSGLPQGNGVPFGPPNLSASYEICRSVHGPIVARDEARGMARSLAYFMWNRELDNIEGVRRWSLAKNAAEFRQASSVLTWNENVTYATKDGDIGYIHPGYFPRRHALADQRFPTPGDGSRDWVGVVPFFEMPQVINPAQGYLANWNNKPAYGWFDGEGLGSTSRPGGHNQRVGDLIDQLAAKPRLSYADLFEIEKTAGTHDHRYRDYRPLLADWFARNSAALTAAERSASEMILAWDGLAYGPGINPDDVMAKDGVSATIFGAFVTALRNEMFEDLKTVAIDSAGSSENQNVFSRMSSVGSHVFDHSPMDNLIVRTLYPEFSGLVTRGAYLKGRNKDAVILAALKRALSDLATSYAAASNPPTTADFAKFTRVHPRSIIDSLTGGTIGPSTTMPYLDRGSWIHVWGVEKP